MTDYLPLLSRAVSGLERNTGEARRSVYDRARQALLKQLRSMNPPLAESEITRERLALEEAIRRIETQTTKPAPPRPERPSPPAGDQFNPPTPSAARAPAPPRTPVSNRDEAAEVVDQFEELKSEVARTPAPPAARMAGNPTTPPLAPPQVRRPVSPPPPAARRPAPPPVNGRSDVAADAFDIGLDDSIAPPPKPASPQAARAEPFDPYGAASAPAAPRPGPFRGRSVDYAKADAQKARKAKLILVGTIAGLFAVALLIGIVHRDRIFSMGSSSSRPQQQSSSTEAPKASERIPSDQVPQQQVSRPSQQQGGLAAAVAQRAVLYEENPSAQGGQQLQTFVGTAVWKTETINPGPGRPPELGMRIEVEVPDRKMTVVMTIRRNPDTTLPASHTVEVQFTSPGDPFGGVSNVPGLRAKTTETAQGAPLSGLVVRVMPGFFLIGLSAIDADREQNLMLLRERGWLDLPFVYNNGRRAVLVIEKGQPGERVMNEALAAWGG